MKAGTGITVVILILYLFLSKKQLSGIQVVIGILKKVVVIPNRGKAIGVGQCLPHVLLKIMEVQLVTTGCMGISLTQHLIWLELGTYQFMMSKTVMHIFVGIV